MELKNNQLENDKKNDLNELGLTSQTCNPDHKT
jgi:hypothetical protein